MDRGKGRGIGGRGAGGVREQKLILKSEKSLAERKM